MHLHSSIPIFQQLVENIPAAVAMLDRHMCYIAISRQWLQDYGLYKQNLIGYSHYEVFPEISVNCKAVHQRCLAGAVEKCGIQKIIREDGSYEWFKSEIFPWYDCDGEVGGIIIFNKVICNRQHLEETLEINNNRFQKLAANLPGVIVQILLRADGSISCPYISPSSQYLLGVESRKIVKSFQAFLDLIHPDDYQSCIESMMLSCDKLLPWLWEGRIVTTPGNSSNNYSNNYSKNYKWIRCLSRPEKQDNGDIFCDGLIIDISDKVEAEKGLRQYQSDLETKIQFRTAELQKANERLQAQILEQNQAEETLRKSEARFKKLADNVPGMLFQYVLRPDRTMYFSYVSLGCHELYELEPEDILQDPLTIFNLIYEDDKSLVEKSITTSAHTLQPWNIEHRVVTKSGKLKWVQGHSRPERQVNGDTVWNGFITDITERKEVEEEREKFVYLVENSSDFIAMATLDAKTSFINEAGQKLVGIYSEEKYKNTTILDYHAPEDAKFFEKVIAPAVMKYGRWEGEFAFSHFETGKRIPIEYNVFAIKHQVTQKPIAFATVTRDISERKQAEAALKQSEARSRELARREQLLNRLADQIRESLDLDKVLETAMSEIRDLLKIDRCSFSWFTTNTNPAIWETIKEARNPNLPSLIGRHSIEKVGPVTELFIRQEILKIDDVQECEEPIHRQFLESLGIKSEIVLPIQTSTGRIGVIVCGHWSEVRPWTESEVELLEAVVDQLAIAIQQAELYAQTQQTAITAQKQAQKIERTLQELQRTQTQLVQSEKMSSLGQLVAGVAHEINNPVNFIYGNLEYAKIYTQDILQLIKLYQEHYPQPAAEILDEIEAIDLEFLVADIPNLVNSMRLGAERIREIVQSLRTFSRLDEAEMKAVNIHEGIESTLMILQNRFKPKQNYSGIEIVKEYGKLPLIACYAGQLNQVFMNLLANAIDALEEAVSKNKVSHPTITIITKTTDSNCVSISILDNGVGITPEAQKRLFDPFFTTKPVGIGTGLGLSISYQIIVDKHGGQLRCNSQVGKGTEFIIEIPLSQPNNS